MLPRSYPVARLSREFRNRLSIRIGIQQIAMMTVPRTIKDAASMVSLSSNERNDPGYDDDGAYSDDGQSAPYAPTCIGPNGLAGSRFPREVGEQTHADHHEAEFYCE